MTDILNERNADKIVINNLIKELRKRGHMGLLLIDPKTGKLYNVEVFEEVTIDDLAADIERSQKNISTITEFAEAARQFQSESEQENEQPAAPQEAAPIAPVEQAPGTASTFGSPAPAQDAQTATPAQDNAPQAAPVVLS